MVKYNRYEEKGGDTAVIQTRIDAPINYTSESIANIIADSLGFARAEITTVEIRRRELDLSDKSNPAYKMTVAFSASPEREMGLLKMKKRVFPDPALSFSLPERSFDYRPLVVGAGPSGLFAALALARAGAMPILVERGLPVDERAEKVSLFNKFGVLDPECNVQFGEGGAGTYSDGKLKYGSMDKYKLEVLREFVAAGADGDILYTVGAHLGTDKLSDIVKRIREKIISLGGDVRFSTRLIGITVRDGAVVGATLESQSGRYTIDTRAIILATGHSAEDTFRLLESLGVAMTPKGFGIGVRIEHRREYIDDLVYGKGHGTDLPTASYHLVTHLSSGRSVYSFCMCPGGTVVAAASTESGVVTNGMSEYLRDGDNSNAALLVSVTPDDFSSDSPLAGIELQRMIEKAAFNAAGGNYRAPVWRIGDLMDRNATSRIGDVSPSYPRGFEFISPEAYLPDFITESLRVAMTDFDEWMPGYYQSDAVLTGAETRSTSPVRVERDGQYQSLTLRGLYPAGEGAGYAGGIVSSATDGLRAAEALLRCK